MILHYGPSLEITTGAIVDAKFNKLPKEEKAAIQRWADQYGGNANREKEVQDRTAGEQVNILKWALGQNGGLAGGRTMPAPRGRPSKAAFRFGRMEGKTIEQVLATDPSYLKWLCDNRR